MQKYILYGVLICLLSCTKNIDNLGTDKLFTNIPADISGVNFKNKILESEKLHYYKYLYIYIGGGVAAADFNNDGLQDLFFTSNIYPNKLFLNKGDFKFEDITLDAGIEKRVGFDAGVSVADVNNDGFLDIYINRAGWYTGNERLTNMLYINNGDLTFTEEAEAYGLADVNRSISSTFFDYDKDGDLDVYITNAPSDFNLSGALLDLDKIQRQKEKIESSKSSDKLYRNNGNGSFEDVSEAAGILPDLGFGLHAQVGDLNNDGWPDIYVSNDFIMPDFAYINNGDGTFTDKTETMFKHISYYSMGGDFADINNDGLSDLMVADMSPEDYVRSKTTMSMMSIDRFNAMTNNGYQYQYMHNVMQLNNGNGTYSEIAQLSGVAKTDWSWATLFADFDLDGYNDLYVTNGVYRDVVDRDANNAINEQIKKNKANLKEKDFYEFTQKLPQQKLTNYFFKNKGDTQFENTSEDWANESPTFSNGAVYVDLDNDGDLDVVTNNLDENATILRNNAREISGNNFLQVKFNGPAKNKFGVGTIVKVHQNNGQKLVRELVNARGYLSSTSNILHFGLGEENNLDKIEVIWFDGKTQILKNVDANQMLTIDYSEANKDEGSKNQTKTETFFKEQDFDFSHSEIPFKDYDKQLLLPHKLSQTGPATAKTDLNNDGLDEVFIGGAHQQPAQLLVANNNGSYSAIDVSDFKNDGKYEDVSACFFDADNDGDDDLYVASGSYEFTEDSELLQDRLYINYGNFNFKRANSKLPTLKSSSSVVKASDYDNDGDLDLFVGSRVIPGKYPYAPSSHLLINEKGAFIDGTQQFAQDVANVGMVTDAQWHDIDNDDDLDLIVTGEWMGIEVFLNNKGLLSKAHDYTDLEQTKGWWNSILIEDIDGDGDKDIIAGNLGLNYKFHASKTKPFHVYTNDFDNNGIEDIVLAKYYDSKQVPVRGKSCASQQMPFLNEKIKTYNEFANSDIEGIFGDGIQSSLHYEVTEFRSGIFINEGNGDFSFKPFPVEVQRAPINSIIFEDMDGDNVKDLLMAGNNYQSEVETTRADAGIGTFLKGKTQGQFKYHPNHETGFYADGNVRALLYLKNVKGHLILVANNNNRHKVFKLSNKK